MSRTVHRVAMLSGLLLLGPIGFYLGAVLGSLSAVASYAGLVIGVVSGGVLGHLTATRLLSRPA